MTPDRQEALSRTHSRGLWCVPLDNGRIAIFSHPNSQDCMIYEDWPTVVDFALRLAAERSAVRPRKDTYDLDIDIQL